MRVGEVCVWRGLGECEEEGWMLSAGGLGEACVHANGFRRGLAVRSLAGVKRRKEKTWDVGRVNR